MPKSASLVYFQAEPVLADYVQCDEEGAGLICVRPATVPRPSCQTSLMLLAYRRRHTDVLAQAVSDHDEEGLWTLLLAMTGLVMVSLSSDA